MTELHIWRQENKEIDGEIIISARLEYGQQRNNLFFKLPVEYASFITDSCDSLTVACILMAMRNKARMIVHGDVSPSLLRNLAMWQEAWHCWLPQKYHLVDIEACREVETPKASPTDRVVAAFTGGVDSSFTIARHCREGSGRLQRTIEAGLFVHGFDIPLADEAAFNRAAAKARETLSSVSVNLVTMASNHRDFNLDWNDTHGIGIASCLMLLSKRYSEGLIASTYSYDGLFLPWGSNPVSDWMLSSDAFKITHDGAETTRSRKTQMVSQWTDAWRNLRVCFSATQKDEDCGQCSKCISTALGLMAAAMELPPSFPGPVTDKQILSMTVLEDDELEVFEIILARCQKNGITDSWVKALQACVRNDRRRRKLAQAPARPWHKLRTLGQHLLSR